MATVQLFKVNSLPTSPEADALYFVKDGDTAEFYLTDSTGAAVEVGNTSLIQALVDAAIAEIETGVIEWAAAEW